VLSGELAAVTIGIRDRGEREVSMTSQAAQLTWDVYVTELTPTASDDPPPGAKQFLWQPTSATLICG
jgi:hypothetical protein